VLARADAPHGNPVIQYTTIDNVCATWVADGALGQAGVASVRHRAAAQQRALSVWRGDGPQTVAQQGGRALAPRGTNIRRARQASRSRPPMALS
jgi:hypothetical protein